MKALNYLTFTIGEAECAIRLEAIQELKVWEGVSRLPLASPYVLGAMNLRGEIVPVLDLLYRFESRHIQINNRSVVILCRLKSGKIVGALVDLVKDVREFEDSAIRPVPEGFNYPSGLVSGLISLPEEIVLLVNPESFLEASHELVS